MTLLTSLYNVSPVLHGPTFTANATLFIYVIKFWYKLIPPYIHRLERIYEAGFN